MINTLSKTKEILKKYDIVANKRFGQNFLIDDFILNEITEGAKIGENDLVIEIGPGLGNLTQYLLDNSKHVLLIEIDKNLINILKKRFEEYTNYTLINGDILKLDLDKKIKEIEDNNNIKFEKVKVVANLPYYITTPILFKLLKDEKRIDEIVVMVQKEVALRMISKHNSKVYGVLSIMTQYLSEPEIIINVPNNSFIPAPNVESAVIKLKKEKRYRVENEDVFFKLVHSSFFNRRKKIINSIVNSNFMNLDKSEIENILKELNISINIRAEELNIKQYIMISDYISNKY